MSATLNKVTLIGHLGEDIRVHYFENGSCTARFSLATNEVYKNKETLEKRTHTEWHQIVVHNKTAEICEKYLSKGDKIYVEGRLRSRQWQAEDGSSKSMVEIVGKEILFLQTKHDAQKTILKEPSAASKNKAFQNFKIPKENNNDKLPF